MIQLQSHMDQYNGQHKEVTEVKIALKYQNSSEKATPRVDMMLAQAWPKVIMATKI
jgi:hypothetical protein